MKAAERGTVNDGNLVYQLGGRTYLPPIKTIRGDHRDKDGSIANNVRRWEKREFKPRKDDVFQERLYCVQWIDCDTINTSRWSTWFAAPTEQDLDCEQRINAMLSENTGSWQDEGLTPDMEIEPGGPPRYQGQESAT
jgi:putative DNA methylase